MSSVQSAVTFLRDPSVRDSSLAKKVAFLEAKGLSQQDIDTALRLAAAQPNYGSFNPNQLRQQQQQLHPDWRDWFIMAVVGGGVGTVVYSLARKYLYPALKPPTESELEQAQQALAAKYDEAATILADLQTETSEIKATLSDQCSKVDESVEQVNSALQAIKEKESDRDDELKSMREEVDSVKALLEKMFEKHKEAQSTSLGDIQQEVKSLKSLLARRADAPASTASTSGTATPPYASSLPTSVSSPALHQPTPSYPQYASPYASSGRFGTSGAGRESPSLASIANRPPGIPSWQLPTQPAAAPVPQANSSTSTTAPAAEKTEPSKPDEAAKADSNGASVSEGSDTMAESAEMVNADDVIA